MKVVNIDGKKIVFHDTLKEGQRRKKEKGNMNKTAKGRGVSRVLQVVNNGGKKILRGRMLKL